MGIISGLGESNSHFCCFNRISEKKGSDTERNIKNQHRECALFGTAENPDKK